MISYQVTTESERVLVKLVNEIIEKGYLYKSHVDKICYGLTENEKKGVLKRFSSNRFVKAKEGIYKYADVVYDNVLEQDIFKSIIKPDFVNITKRYAQVGNKYYYGLYTESFPATTRINWLYQLAGEKGNVDFSIHVHPTDTNQEIKDLNKELTNINYDIASSPKEEPHLVQKTQEIRQKIQELSSMAYKLCTTDLYFTAKALTPEKAETLAKSVKSNLGSAAIDTKFATDYQQPLLKSIIPLGKNFLKAKQLSIGTDALGESDPYSYPWLDIDEKDGILLGWSENDLPIAKSLWKLPSYSGIIIGPTGRGKSFTAKAFIDQDNMINDTQIIIIDPAATKGQEPEYKRMCEMKKGTYISFSTHSKNIPNINSLYGDSFHDALIDVNTLYNVLLGDKKTGMVTDAQKPIIEDALTKMYELYGITEDPSTWKKVPPIDPMKTILQKQLKSAQSQNTRDSCEALLKRLTRFMGRGLYNFINTKGTNLSIDNNFTVFAFQDTPEDIKSVLTGIVMNHIKDRAAGSLKKTLIVIDEAHIWLANPILAAYILRMVKTLRKTNTGLLLIFQDITDLENCKEGFGVLSNVEFKYIMGCKPNALKLLGERLDLNEIELNYLASCAKGEGLLIWGNDHYRMRTMVDEETYKVITTNPEDIKKFKEEQQQKSVFDEHTRICLKEDLNQVPDTIEESAKLLAQKISKGDLDKSIVYHYHYPINNMIKERLRELGIDPQSHYHEVNENVIDSIAHKIHKEFFASKRKAKKHKRKKHGHKKRKK